MAQIDRQDDYSGDKSYAPNQQKMQNVSGIYDWVIRIYTRYAELIAGVSWKADDVSPSWATVVQQGYQGNTYAPPLGGTGFPRLPESGGDEEDEGEEDRVIDVG